MTTVVTLGELMPSKKSSLDPRKTPDQEFELYSIPAYDDGEPEIVEGAEVGSTKQVVCKGDVLLSRIVPHIRRAWVVDPISDRATIGSSEWIIFRSERFDSAYLRHALLSDRFHQSFMQTVAGVGGSLLRARPAVVADIEIPFPPIGEQRRIAAVLDAADALRTKRREALAKLDTLTQAIFIDMFGSPGPNPSGYDVVPMIEIVDMDRPITYGILKPGGDIPDGVPYVRVVDMVDRSVDAGSLRRTAPEISDQYKRSLLREGDLLLSIRGHVGRLAMVAADVAGANITQDTARLAVTGAEPSYVLECLRSVDTQRWMTVFTKGAAVKGINLTDVKKIPIPLPPWSEQQRFGRLIERATVKRKAQREAIDRLDTLFASLQKRAFRGEL